MLPHEPAAGRPAFTGGYGLAIIAACALWMLGFLAILLVGRKKKHEEDHAATDSTGSGD